MAMSREEREGRLAELLRELTAIPGPCGYEDAIAERVIRCLEPYASSVAVDGLGNVVAKIRPGAPSGEEHRSWRLMIFAHMDEIGFVVRAIEPDGYLRIVRVGGVSEAAMASQKVLVRADASVRRATAETRTGSSARNGETWVPGVIGTKSHHYVSTEEKDRVVPVESAYVDIGCETEEEVRNMGIHEGSPVVYSRSFIRNRSRVYANSLDNRGGLAVLLEAARIIAEQVPAARGQDRPEVWVVASVQEEFNVRGVMPAVAQVAPDIAICLDIAVACDTPDLRGYSRVALGRGPVLNYFSFHGRGTLGGLIPNPRLAAWIEELAASKHISLQRNVFFGGLTDASFAQLMGQGIPMVDLAFPVRYTHSPVEECDLRDLSGLVELLVLIASVQEKPDLRRGITPRSSEEMQ